MIQLDHVTKSFKQITILSDVNYTFEEGDSYCLVGPNGSGKSVFLQLITGLSQPDKGKIIVDDQVLGEDFDFLPEAGISINQPEFMQNWTGWENLVFLASLRRRVQAPEIRAWVSRFCMDKDIDRVYRVYSQGMRQKLRLIQAFMENPRYLILDEPFNALDKKAIDILLTCLADFSSPENTLIMTCHTQDLLEQTACKIVEMEELTS